MKRLVISIIAFCALNASYAGIYTYPPGTGTEVLSNDGCTTSGVQITGIYEITSSGVSTDPVLNTDTSRPYNINSTSCLGYVITPDNDWGKEPSPNIGTLYDGLLNGELSGNDQSTDRYYVDPSTFLTNLNDTWVDENTPGWLSLASGDTPGDIIYNTVGESEYDLDDVLDITFDINGTWSLFVDPSAIGAASIALGRPALFDHLTFVLKGSNNEEASWAIYDFNFWDLIDDGLDISLGDTAYYFTGTWDTDVINGQDLSHFSMWAHDPVFSVVPEPAPLALLGFGLAAIAFTRRKKQHLI